MQCQRQLPLGRQEAQATLRGDSCACSACLRKQGEQLNAPAHHVVSPCPSQLQAVYPLWAACLNGDEPSWKTDSACPSALKGFGRVAVHGRKFAYTSAASLLQDACQLLLRCLPGEHPYVARTAGERLSLGAAQEGDDR